MSLVTSSCSCLHVRPDFGTVTTCLITIYLIFALSEWSKTGLIVDLNSLSINMDQLNATGSSEASLQKSTNNTSLMSTPDTNCVVNLAVDFNSFVLFFVLSTICSQLSRCHQWSSSSLRSSWFHHHRPVNSACPTRVTTFASPGSTLLGAYLNEDPTIHSGEGKGVDWQQEIIRIELLSRCGAVKNTWYLVYRFVVSSNCHDISWCIIVATPTEAMTMCVQTLRRCCRLQARAVLF